MDEVIKLGEQIELYGFNSVDRGAMMILRKMIGNAARTFSEKNQGFQKLLLKVEGQNPYTVTAEIHTTEGSKTAAAEGSNLFFTIDQAIKQL